MLELSVLCDENFLTTPIRWSIFIIRIMNQKKYICMNMRYFKAVWISISNVFPFFANDVNAIESVYF